MSAEEQVAKLEALLERVNRRRTAPRKAAAAETGHAAPAAEPVVAAPAPVVAPADAATTTPPPAPPPELTAPPPAPPAPVAVAAPAAAAPLSKATVRIETETEVEVESEVEVEEGMAEVDLEGLDDGASLSDSVADLEATATSLPDEHPASSRRPIQMAAPLEELDDIPEEAAPHPPPPESGRQVAIPPAADFEGDLLRSGVRTMPEELVPTTPPSGVPAVAQLKAEVTRPAPVAASASPAVFRGAAPEARPATFGELLDATLSL